MNNVCIEKAKISDIEYICNNLDTKYICTWNKEEFLNCCKMDNVETYIAKTENNILGFITVQSILSDIEILNICVDIEHRKKGIGQLLIKHIINLAFQNSFSTIFLEVNVNNIHAIELYKKVGFQIISTRKGYYFNKLTNNKEDAYIMNFKEEYIC